MNSSNRFLIRRSQKNLSLFEPSFTGPYYTAEDQCQVFFSEAIICLIDMFWKFGSNTGWKFDYSKSRN